MWSSYNKTKRNKFYPQLQTSFRSAFHELNTYWNCCLEPCHLDVEHVNSPRQGSLWVTALGEVRLLVLGNSKRQSNKQQPRLQNAIPPHFPPPHLGPVSLTTARVTCVI